MRLLSFVDHWLPPPALLRPLSLGVDISESSIKYIGFKNNPLGLSALTLTDWGEVELKADTVSRGEVKDVASLAAALGEVKRRSGVNHFRLSLPEERVYLFEVELDPDIDFRDIRGLLEFRLEENVPLSPRDAYFDHRLYREGQDGPVIASVAACPKTVVDAYYEACQKAGVVPISFEVESQAIARAVLGRGDKGTKLLVDFGRTRTGLGIVHQGILSYTSTVDIGGNELSAGLRRQLGDKEESELSRIKNEQGLVKGTSKPAPNEALLPTVSVIKDDIQRHMQYWNDKHASARPIEEIIICGGSANLRGLPEYFRETLNIEAVVADVWQNAFDATLTAPPIDRRHSYGYATAVGLSLASFNGNL